VAVAIEHREALRPTSCAIGHDYLPILFVRLRRSLLFETRGRQVDDPRRIGTAASREVEFSY
jgi:hypothetical protein